MLIPFPVSKISLQVSVYINNNQNSFVCLWKIFLFFVVKYLRLFTGYNIEDETSNEIQTLVGLPQRYSNHIQGQIAVSMFPNGTTPRQVQQQLIVPFQRNTSKPRKPSDLDSFLLPVPVYNIASIFLFLPLKRKIQNTKYKLAGAYLQYQPS